jgi:hypothetical protein
MEYIKTFLNKCKIVMNTYDDLDGMLIPREIFLDKTNYTNVKEDIAVLKQIFASSSLTALQSTAEDNQKWPLLNLVRQILRSCNYKMTPKRISAGYTKDGKKIYKRMFIVERIPQTSSVAVSPTEPDSTTSTSTSTSSSSGNSSTLGSPSSSSK